MTIDWRSLLLAGAAVLPLALVGCEAPPAAGPTEPTDTEITTTPATPPAVARDDADEPTGAFAPPQTPVPSPAAPVPPMPGPSDSPSAPEGTETSSAAPTVETPAATAAVDAVAMTAAPQASQDAKADAAPAEAGQAGPAGEGKAAGQLTGDWPMWGGSPDRNMVNDSQGLLTDFAPPVYGEEGKRVRFVCELGSQTYGNPTVADGKVYVGTNNGAEYRPQHRGDRGVVLCFDADNGKLLWQLTREKLPDGRVSDWPEQGICSAPVIEGERMWIVTNRAELMCLDTNGFHDGQNNGPYTEEVDTGELDADIIWSLSMIDELGVFVHNLATSSPVIHGDMVYVVTSNGVDEAHIELPNPRAPSFIGVNKNTGEVVWTNNEPFDQVLHGQWSSPTLIEANGQTQIVFPSGDGWIYSLDPMTGDTIWKFDGNPKDSKYELGQKGTRNEIVGTPVFYDNSIIFGMGQDPEHGEGVGHLYRVDVTKTGDVSPVTPENTPNPNSAQIWHYGGIDEDGSVTGTKGESIFRRTISTVAIRDGLVIAPDMSGRIHCLDLETGKRYWEEDILSAIWGSPMIVDGHFLIGDEDATVHVFKLSKEPEKVTEIEFPNAVLSTPTIANGILYISDRSRLYAFNAFKNSPSQPEGETGSIAPRKSGDNRGGEGVPD